MSQSGNVLHLYVEVRSAPDQNGGKPAFGVKEEGLSALQDSPAELLSKLASQNVTKASAAQRCARGPSPSRNTVGFRPQPSSGSPSLNKRWSAPCDEVYRLHSSPKTSSCASPGSRTFSKEGGGDGKRSVVTFSYVEKSNVKTLDSPCKSFRDKGTREERSTPSRFHKRLSDPVWFGSPDSSCSSSPKLTFCSPGRHQQTFSPGFCQSELDPIGRAATRRAVEEFGSPLLRIKLAHALEMASSRCTRQQRCQSWAGSPVQRQNVAAINPKDQAAVQSQILSQSRPTLAPAHCVKAQSPRWCYKDDKAPAGSPATQRHPHRTSTRSGSPQEAILPLGNNVPEGLNQLSDSKSSSPAHSPVVARRLAEEATKVSSIFSEVRRSMLHNSFGEEEHIQQSKQTLKMNIPLNDHNMPATDNTDCHQPQGSTPKLPQMNREDLALKREHRGSLLPMSQTSPAIPSRVFRPSHPPTELGSPMRDPRLLQAELRAPDTPTLHRRQLPPYTREPWSSALTNREVLSCSERGDCTELARRLYINQSVEEAPISWTCRQHWGDRVEGNPDTELGSGSVKEQQPDGHPSSQRHRQMALSPTSQQKRAEQRRREILLLGPVALDSAEEDEGCDEEEQGNELEGLEEGEQEFPQRVGEAQGAEQNGAMGGSSSRSSSGVTGSLADRDCVSPESSHSSHQSNETGAATSGIQVTRINCTIQMFFLGGLTKK